MRASKLLLGLVALLWATTATAKPLEHVKSATVDIDGDGKAETITLTIDADTCGYYLAVGKLKIKGKTTACEVDGFAVVDIQTSDKYKEIAVHAAGPSDDDEYVIHWLDGKMIKTMAVVSNLPQFKGNGIVYVDTWMGFWSLRDKYVLHAKKRMLKKVDQAFYWVGAKAKVKTSFSIYKNPGYSKKGKSRSTKVAKLSPNTDIEVVLYNPVDSCPDGKKGAFNCQWYLIKSSTGLMGWAPLSVIHDNTEGLPWAG